MNLTGKGYKFPIGNEIWKLRGEDSTETRLKKSLCHRGRVWTKERNENISIKLKGIKFTNEHKEKLRWSDERRKAFSERQKGSNNPAWIDGRKPLHKRLRHSIEYNQWRNTVFARDNWTCVICGIRNKAGLSLRLEADHIKPFSLYPELRYEVENGRTLCKECHKKTENYGAKLIRK